MFTSLLALPVAVSLFNPFPSIKPFPFESKPPISTPAPTQAPTSTPSPTPTQAPSNVFELEDVEPSSANFMEEFTVYGSNFGSTAGYISFRQSNQGYPSGGATPISWSNTEIKAKVPFFKKGSYRIQIIRSDGSKSNEIKFTIKNGQPVINATSVQLTNGEYELTFQGTEFGTKRGSVNIYSGSSIVAHGTIKSWSSSRVRFGLPGLSRQEYGFQIQASDGRQSSLKYFTLGK